MKRKMKKFVSFLTSVMLCIGMSMTAFANDISDSISTANDCVLIENDGSAEAVETPIPAGTSAQIDLEKKLKEVSEFVSEAKSQFEADDHTPLSEPVTYRILWLGYTHVTYDQLDFRMTDFDRAYLQAVALNFENVVEKYANYNVDISIDLSFIDKTTPLSRLETPEAIYLAKNTAQADINAYMEQAYYDTVFTTFQTMGNENVVRNQGKPGYDGLASSAIGLEFYGLESTLGYSTFNLCEPKEGTYPLEDPQVPSLYATAVAVHEWLHQLEYLGELLGIEYPNTHAYQGPENYPGYEAVIQDKDDYDFFVFYKKVLGGVLAYTDKNGTRNVGMYPKMWRLIRRDVLNIGTTAIKSSSSDFYLTGQEKEPNITTMSQATQWQIRYGGTKGYILTPETLPQKQLTLSSAWDQEGNSLEMYWHNPGYPEAQLWQFTKNADGTYCIRTAYSSGRAVTVARPGAKAVIQSAKTPNRAQKWVVSIAMDTKPEQELPFADVTPAVWYGEPAKFVFSREIMKGMDDTHFGPSEILSRAQFATILYRVELSPAASYNAGAFPDVANGEFYTSPAMWAKSTGVITGYSDGKFGPADDITREQMAVMLYRYATILKLDTSATGDMGSFPDGSRVSSFAQEAMRWAVGEGLITGDSGMINPQGQAQRSHCATIIMRFMKRYGL